MKSDKISKEDFKEDIISDKGLKNPLKDLLKQKLGGKTGK